MRQRYPNGHWNHVINAYLAGSMSFEILKVRLSYKYQPETILTANFCQIQAQDFRKRGGFYVLPDALCQVSPDIWHTQYQVGPPLQEPPELAGKSTENPGRLGDVPLLHSGRKNQYCWLWECWYLHTQTTIRTNHVPKGCDQSAKSTTRCTLKNTRSFFSASKIFQSSSWSLHYNTSRDCMLRNTAIPFRSLFKENLSKLLLQFKILPWKKLTFNII